MMNEAKLRKIINILREHLQEEMPTMSVGHGKIAGTVEAGDDPPVRKKKKKIMHLLESGPEKLVRLLQEEQPMLGRSKVEVLESKLDIYEDLSKQMLEKLEKFMSSIQENSNKIALFLRDMKIDLTRETRANDSILKLIEKVEEDVKSLEAKIESLSRFRWLALGVAATAMLIVNVLQISSDSFVNGRNVLPNVVEQVEKK